jgi:hypothetical protein
MMDNHEKWKEVMQRRKEDAQIEKERKEKKKADREAAIERLPPKHRSCWHPSCNNFIDITTPTSKKANEKTWLRCDGVRCAFWGCPHHFDGVRDHQSKCTKVLPELLPVHEELM